MRSCVRFREVFWFLTHERILSVWFMFHEYISEVEWGWGGWLAGWLVVVGRWGGWVGRVCGVGWVGDPRARSGGCTAQTRSECTQRTFALFTDARCGHIQPALGTMLDSALERADIMV